MNARVTPIGKTLALENPIFIDGIEVEELPYNFDAMTAKDRLSVPMEMNQAGISMSQAEEIDTNYHLFLFAKAVECASGQKIATADVLRCSALDASRAGRTARDFFYLGG